MFTLIRYWYLVDDISDVVLLLTISALTSTSPSVVGTIRTAWGGGGEGGETMI